MTATRCPVLTCDNPQCTRATWQLEPITISALRRKASTHGWAFFDRKDWCAEHADRLGISSEEES